MKRSDVELLITRQPMANIHNPILYGLNRYAKAYPMVIIVYIASVNFSPVINKTNPKVIKACSLCLNCNGAMDIIKLS